MNKFKKTADFLSQIPEFEKKYKESDDIDITFERNDWKKEEAHFTDRDLKIFGYSVMEIWETPYMKELADVACMNGGVILELGYGMGISAKFIQSHKISKHIIIEANSDVAEKAMEFAKKASCETVVLNGFWEDEIEKIADGSVDGILFDTYPLTELEIFQNHFNFFPFAFKKLCKGGVFTYYSDEEKDFGRVHLKKLKEAGFINENIGGKVTKVNTPKDCEYWKANTFLTPIIIK